MAFWGIMNFLPGGATRPLTENSENYLVHVLAKLGNQIFQNVLKKKRFL
jgi:hypothetical protein